MELTDDQWEYYWEMEKDWKKSLSRYSQKDLLEIFGEDAICVFKDKIIELKDELKEEKKYLNDLYQKKANAKEAEAIFYGYCIEKQTQAIEEIERRIKRFTFQVNKSSGAGNSKQFDIEQIKETPISDVIGNPARINGNRALYNCPLHQEDSPSFTWYKDQNSWWCYGCSQGGSVIDLVMKLNNCDFVSACKILTK